MKKRILLIVIASFMFMGVVSAASLWGSYKGNQVIRLTVNDDPIKVSDVPAISYNGRTMIPIYLLQQAGINYSWDSKNQTVNITKPQIESSPDENLIIYAEISNHYNRLKNLGDMIWESGDRIMDAKTNIDLGSNTQDSINHAAKSIENSIKVYDILFKDNQLIINKASSISMNISNTNDILDNYYSAMDFYVESLSELKNYVNNNSSNSYDNYMNNLKSGDSKADIGKRLSSEGYQYYIYRIIDSK